MHSRARDVARSRTAGAELDTRSPANARRTRVTAGTAPREARMNDDGTLTLSPPAPASRPPSRKGRSRTVPILGPAFVAAIAYVDPGNVATNLTAGATSGYLLVWVVVLASLVALLVQFQAAKLGMATGKSLPRLCRERFSRRGGLLLWLQAEVVVLATDLAEFVGAAIGMQLLFGMPPAMSAVVTAVVALLMLQLRRHGRTRRFELVSAASLLLVGAGVVYDVVAVGRQSATGLAGGLIPHLDGSGSLVLAMGIVGATVMPHAIYLHSALVQGRGWPVGAAWRRPALVRRALRIDCLLGLGTATVVNVSMIALGAGLGAATGGRPQRRLAVRLAVPDGPGRTGDQPARGGRPAA
ncbi:Nramp family divalent metal transporter, partial [Streptosporangium sp. NPDC048865]|uniref:Nramp family divalent metal transporter n=1 Tax=Streptosporangium sp. NPDC048865 TaxID=3155766 RepID=UPI003414093E